MMNYAVIERGPVHVTLIYILELRTRFA